MQQQNDLNSHCHKWSYCWLHPWAGGGGVTLTHIAFIHLLKWEEYWKKRRFYTDSKFLKWAQNNVPKKVVIIKISNIVKSEKIRKTQKSLSFLPRAFSWTFLYLFQRIVISIKFYVGYLILTINVPLSLKGTQIENFFDSDFGICVISLLVMSKYFTKKIFWLGHYWEGTIFPP